MKGAMNREAVAALPKVYEWLGYAEAAAQAADGADDPLLAVTEANVLLQLHNLTTHPAVSAAMASGSLDLHGWVYHIGSGDVTVTTRPPTNSNLWQSSTPLYCTDSSLRSN